MPGAYLDHAATTPLRPEAWAAMAPLLGAPDPSGTPGPAPGLAGGPGSPRFGNPSGSHRWAREARRRLDDARDVVAEAVGAHPAEVVFTSGGTEADDLAVNGVLAATGGRVLCSAVEHHAVLEPVRASVGAALPVDRHGRLDLDALRVALRPGPAGNPTGNPTGSPVSLVSVLLANNELGTLQDLDAIAAVIAARSPGTVLHTDAVAAAAWVDLAERTRAAQLVSLSAHKIGGPQGIGALVVRGGTPLAARLLGGGQEQERRSGTPNVAGAVGFAAALVATARDRAATVERVEALRARLVTGLVESIPDLVVLSPLDPTDRTAGTLHVAVPGVEREALLFLLDQAGVGASWGSSCSSGATEPSHVLAAIGVDPALAAGGLRLSLGWCSTEADVDAALAAVPAAVDRLRGAPAAAGTAGRGGTAR